MSDKRIQAGTYKGERNGNSKLSYPDTIAIREAFKDGWTQKSLAKEYGVGKTTINHVISGRNWK